MAERIRRPRYDWQPMAMTWEEVAKFVFRRSEPWLRLHLPHDFPRPHPIYDLFATDAVLGWMRKEYNLVSEAGGRNDAEARLLGKLTNGHHQGQVSSRSAT
jgi:hypothetical protein